MNNLCECGCGVQVNHPKARFINGHWLKLRSNRDNLPQAKPYSKCSSERYMEICEERSQDMQGNKRWKNSKGFTGKTHTEAARESQRRNIVELGLPGKVYDNSGIGITGYRNIAGNQIWFRSTWEANFARYLNYKKIPFVFEPRTFPVIIKDKKTTYLPDFYIESKKIYYEIKGYVTKESIERIKQVRKLGIKIYLIDKRWYKKIEDKYKSLIDGWE